MTVSNVNAQDFFVPGDARLFIQKGPTRPGAPYEYLGTGETMAADVKLGATTPVRIQSRAQRRKWNIAGTKVAPPDLSTTGVHMLMPRAVASFVETMAKTGCVVNMQIVIGACNSPDEFDTGWESKVLYEACHLDGFKTPEMPSVDGSKLDEVYIDGSMTFENYERITGMRFGQKASATIVSEVIDGVYAGPPSCGDCGPYSEGNDHLYVITKANPGSAGLSGQMIYTNDGDNFTDVDIPTLGGLSPNAIGVVGDFIVVVSEAARNLQYCRRKAVISSADWAEVTSGFVAAHGPRAIYVKNPGEVFMAAAAGYIYKATNYQQTVAVSDPGSASSNNYNAIDGDGGDTIVVVGDADTIVVSSNSGETWSVVVSPTSGSDLQAVAVIDENNWLIGGDGGAFYYTNDGGLNWTTINFALMGAGAIVQDIKFNPMSEQVGYMALEVGGRGYVFRTTDAGSHWYNDEPAIRGLDANVRINFVAPSPNSVNVVAAGGLGLIGTDGYLAVAA